MEIKKLRAERVKKAEVGTKEYRLSDGGGLYLVVKLNGGNYGAGPMNSTAKRSCCLTDRTRPSLSLRLATSTKMPARKRLGFDPAAEKQEQKRAEGELKDSSSMLCQDSGLQPVDWSVADGRQYIAIQSRYYRFYVPGTFPLRQVFSHSSLRAAKVNEAVPCGDMYDTTASGSSSRTNLRIYRSVCEPFSEAERREAILGIEREFQQNATDDGEDEDV